eukprot:5629679-Pyramimonas_sp.AAC.1
MRWERVSSRMTVARPTRRRHRIAVPPCITATRDPLGGGVEQAHENPAFFAILIIQRGWVDC